MKACTKVALLVCSIGMMIAVSSCGIDGPLTGDFKLGSTVWAREANATQADLLSFPSSTSVNGYTFTRSTDSVVKEFHYGCSFVAGVESGNYEGTIDSNPSMDFEIDPRTDTLILSTDMGKVTYYLQRNWTKPLN